MPGVRVTVYPGAAIAEARAALGEQLMQVAQAVEQTARGSAPVETGQFRNSFGVEGSAGAGRIAVVNTDPAAFYIEYGTSDTPAHATLTNAARQYGKYTGMQPRGGG